MSLFLKKLSIASLSALIALPAFASQASANNVAPNEDRLLETLEKEGVIESSNTPEQKDEKLKQYMDDKGEQYRQKYIPNKGLFDKRYNKGNNGKRLGKLEKNKKEMYKKQNNGKRVDKVQEEKYNGKVRKDKVLVLAMEFPDYPNSSITKDETDMYYDEYPISHFQDMVFGENGYKGPNDENLMSMKQYYKNQSGGSYDVDGQVHGWYKAKHDASYYGGNVPDDSGSDGNPKELIKEALEQAAKDSTINLSDYDQWDRDDIDGDGVYDEKDGIVDHIMIVHSGPGEEAGGGKLGTDAIWSHRWSLDFDEQGEPYTIPGTDSGLDQFDGKLAAIDYTVQPEDGAAGVFSHEYGHDLGLPDEYDTEYSGKGEPVSFWSIMSSGSWAGAIPGTEPTGFDPYMKEMLQQQHGGNWQTGNELDATEFNGETSELIDEATTKGTNSDALKVNLPEKSTLIQKPAQGKKAYWSGADDDSQYSMTSSLDLTSAKTSELNFKTWYDIEQGFDYGYVQVSTDDGENWENVKGSITNNDDPAGSGQNQGNGIDGKSNGYVDAKFDLSKYDGKKVKLRFLYVTDKYESNPGWFIDQIKVSSNDGKEILSDDAEADSKFELQGFEQSDGNRYDENYYLLQWRNFTGPDKGLQNIKRGGGTMSYNKGLTVWYVDKSFSDNNVSNHPGQGFISIVDADQNALNWEKKGVADDPATTQFQIRDAAFSLDHQPQMKLKNAEGYELHDNKIKKNPLFDDSKDYSNKGQKDAGVLLPNHGLKFEVTAKSKDNTVGKVKITK
ncbi:immune inhibitor A domain-containing protein [Mammaliicoccus fleurettii]|uniref:immune inhibitor A domain-containing protein n=1 Tax=Mammaliicoccus fleurettii TaxID=150056 RepID=UPI002DBFFA94|nr:immune inhibitor A domain-containing protein [Mammaliicoccus fleurettii]MEB8069015.1 immune inhibitor A [Mammaliicoccus fleurettii]